MNKRDALLCVIFSILTLSLFGQNINGAVAYYLVRPVENDNHDGSSDIARSLEPFSDEISKSFLFKLEFNKAISRFTLSETQEQKQYSESSLKLSLIQFGYSDTSYQTNGLLLSKTFIDFQNKEPVFLKEDLSNPTWKITKETKIIGDLTCFKATRTAIIKRGKKTFSTPLIAWFCPDIPFSFGPSKFGNLPGLIIEAQTDKYLYGLKSIKFDQNAESINLPNLKQYSEEELIKRFQEIY